LPWDRIKPAPGLIDCATHYNNEVGYVDYEKPYMWSWDEKACGKYEVRVKSDSKEDEKIFTLNM